MAVVAVVLGIVDKLSVLGFPLMIMIMYYVYWLLLIGLCLLNAR